MAEKKKLSGFDIFGLGVIGLTGIALLKAHKFKKVAFDFPVDNRVFRKAKEVKSRSRNKGQFRFITIRGKKRAIKIG